MSATVLPLPSRLAAERAARRWVAAAVADLSAVDGSRALAVGPGGSAYSALLARRHQHVLLATGLLGSVAVVPGGSGSGTVRVSRRQLLEVEPEIDGRFELVLAVDAIRRLDVDQLVLPHLGWLLARGGQLVALDPVGQADWAAIQRRYLNWLPAASVQPVQPGLMGLRWRSPTGPVITL